jgi:hypothetical protein
MTTTTSPDAVESVLRAASQVTVPDVSAGLDRHPLAEAADAAGLTTLFGQIVLAGSYPNGTKWVQFNVNGGGGYASSWPDWAYDIAEKALVDQTKVLVLSNGDPFGSNLSLVLLYA